MWPDQTGRTCTQQQLLMVVEHHGSFYMNKNIAQGRNVKCKRMSHYHLDIRVHHTSGLLLIHVHANSR